MNKTTLIDAASQRSGVDKAIVRTVLAAVTDEITQALVDGEHVQITGFGTFETYLAAPRTLYQPYDKSRRPLGARHVPRLRFAPRVRNAVNDQ